jgi:transcriptional regulator
MYIPKHNQMQNQDELISFIQSHSFGILFSNSGNGPIASHLPFLIERTPGGNLLLITHMAKANLHWKAKDCEALVVFSGPHAYISPTWYGADYLVVPTWNYTAVHAYGKLQILEDQSELISILEKTTAYFESSQPKPWKPDFVQSDAQLQLIKAVIAVKIELTSLEGKWKLSQNHPAENVQNVAQALEEQNDPDAAAVAQLMRTQSIS